MTKGNKQLGIEKRVVRTESKWKKEMGKSAAINNRAGIFKRHIVLGAHKKKRGVQLSRLIMPENNGNHWEVSPRGFLRRPGSWSWSRRRSSVVDVCRGHSEGAASVKEWRQSQWVCCSSEQLYHPNQGGARGQSQGCEGGRSAQKTDMQGVLIFLPKQPSFLSCCKSPMEETSYCVPAIEKLCACVDGHVDRQTDTWPILWLILSKQMMAIIIQIPLTTR